MVDWGKGYITDVEYLDTFHPTMAPQHLALTAAFNGVEPPDLAGTFTYCELGCSRGLTSLILAAVNPRAIFHAVDFNPASIAHAAARARAAGLGNVTFHERSFEELTEPAARLPKFDIVAMHGVWTWVAPELHRAIVAFLSSHLKPGGLVCVSYNVLPAWNEMMPLQRLLRELSAGQAGLSNQGAGYALAMLNRLAEKKIIPPRFREGIMRLNEAASRSQDLTYFVHEYLHTGWAPYYFADVARALGEAKLGYVGSTRLMKSFSDIGLNEEQRALLSEIAAPELKETLGDFCINNQFRQDVYVRGARPMMDAKRMALLNALPLALVAPVPEVFEVVAPTGERLRPNPAVFGRILEAMQTGPRTVRELLACAGAPVGAFELVTTLVDSGLARPWRGLDREARDASTRLNAAARDVSSVQAATIAVPTLGLGLNLPAIEFALYTALRGGEEPDAAAVAADLVGRWRAVGIHPSVNGEPIENEAEALAVMTRECAAKIAQYLPIWRMLEILPG